MRIRPAFFAVTMTVVMPCWFAVSAQQQTPSQADHIPIDPADVAAIAKEISARAEHLKPMFEEVHATEWVTRGAPETYVSQLSSLTEQNQAIRTDMAGIAGRMDDTQDASLQQILKAIFRVQRFDRDLDGLMNALRRYQNPALADLIESVAAGDQNGVEKLQQYVLDLADEKARQLDVEDKEAQRCRAMLATQPPVRPSAPNRTNGNPK